MEVDFGSHNSSFINFGKLILRLGKVGARLGQGRGKVLDKIGARLGQGLGIVRTKSKVWARSVQARSVQARSGQGSGKVRGVLVGFF